MITRLLIVLAIAIAGYGINERLIQLVTVQSHRLDVELKQYQLILDLVAPLDLDAHGAFDWEDEDGNTTS